jgi:hypothetical protein
MKIWQYRQANKLEEGNIVTVLSPDSNLPEEATIESIEFKKGEKIFYRLNVEPTDNYFANTLCVHNSDEEKSGDDEGASDDFKNALKTLEKCSPNPSPFTKLGCPVKGMEGDAKEWLDKACKDSDDANKHMEISKQSKVPPALQKAAKWTSLLGAIAAKSKAGCPLEEAANTLLAVKSKFCGGTSPYPDPCCIEEETLITTPSGIVPVKFLKKKQEVLSYDIEGMTDSTGNPLWSLWHSENINGNLKPSVIRSNKYSIWTSWYKILLSNKNILNITYEHPVLVKAEGTPSLIG